MTDADLRLLAIITLAVSMIPLAALSLVALAVALAPRPITRRLRHKLADFVLWQWLKGSKISSIVHSWLWQENNGKSYDYTQDSHK